MHNTDSKEQQYKSYITVKYLQNGSEAANTLWAEAEFSKLVMFSVDLTTVNSEVKTPG